jgi:hypothetical protein
MPLPMVHFKTAYSVLSKTGAADIDQPLFYIGSLAPDSVHSRQNYTLADRSYSHFKSKDVSQWFENINRFLLEYKTSSDFSFYLGYAVHIMTDIIWEEKVFKRFLQSYQKIKDSVFINERQAYIKEVCYLDMQIYNTEINFRNEIRSYLKQAKIIELQPYVTYNELEKEKELTLTWYEDKKNHPVSFPNLITLKDVYEFIDSASEEISDILKNIQ